MNLWTVGICQGMWSFYSTTIVSYFQLTVLVYMHLVGSLRQRCLLMTLLLAQCSPRAWGQSSTLNTGQQRPLLHPDFWMGLDLRHKSLPLYEPFAACIHVVYLVFSVCSEHWNFSPGVPLGLIPTLVHGALFGIFLEFRGGVSQLFVYYHYQPSPQK